MIHLVHVRVARVSDARDIARVHIAAWRRAYAGLMPRETLDGLDLEERRARWERNLGESVEGLTTIVAERDGGVVAFGSFGACRDEAREPGDGEVWALYAAPEAWGTGAGRALMTQGLAFLSGRGHTRAVLWVLERNARGVRFYERAGFALDGARKEPDGLPHARMTRPLRGSPPRGSDA